MIEATSCGGVVIFRGKILLLYKNYRNRYRSSLYYIRLFAKHMDLHRQVV